jgi:UDP-2-acetamido-3-amino-2,3-dideoxy-glucuronate N-acetyltransferase
VESEPSFFVHPKGLCESEDIGANTRIWAFAHVMPGARVGAGCNIGDHAFVETGVSLGDNVTVKNAVLLWRGVTIEDDVFLGPNCVFTNDLRPRSGNRKPVDGLLETVVRRNATIGANATVLCGLEIGPNAFVAAGAVVVRDVAAHALVTGNPAARIGWVCTCGERLDSSLQCPCGRRYRLIGGGTALEQEPEPGHR